MEEIIIILTCLAVNALLSCVEMAFVTVGRGKLKELASRGSKEAKRILKLRDNPERTLSVIQVGITLVGALAAAAGGAGAEETIAPLLRTHFDLSSNMARIISIVAVVLPITYLSVVVGELVPKTLALRNPLRIMMRAARWLNLFEKLLDPLVTALEWSTKKVIDTFFRRSKPIDPMSVQLAATTVELDQLGRQAREYVLNLVNIEKKRAQDVLLPWENVISICTTHTMPEVETIIISSGHTRLPVLKEDGNVVGILNTKEFMALRQSGSEDWWTIVRPILQIQTSDALLKILRNMQEKQSHLAIVYEEPTKTPVGIVTMEDIIEEVIGDIYDEDDDGAVRRLLTRRIISRPIAKTATKSS